MKVSASLSQRRTRINAAFACLFYASEHWLLPPPRIPRGVRRVERGVLSLVCDIRLRVARLCCDDGGGGDRGGNGDDARYAVSTVSGHP